MRGQPHARLIQMQDGSIGFESSYDPGLVAALKAAIPHPDRRWDPIEKLWRVATHHAQTLIDLSTQYLGVTARVQGNLFAAANKPVTKLVKLEYLGMAKDRGGDEPSSMGFADGDWSLLFPLSVLRGWFEFGDEKPTETTTLYSVLGVKRNASGSEIKKAYRRAARSWHPDICKEPDATEQFQRINNAYQILSDPLTRKKYNAGLALEATIDKRQGGFDYQLWSKVARYGVWRPPLRCGWVLVEGIYQLGRLNATKILQWEDITDAQGRTMVSFWPRGGDKFSVRWA